MENAVPMIVHQLPRDHLSRQEWDKLLTEKLYDALLRSLTKAEYQSWANQDDKIDELIVRKIDDVIIDQFRTLGSQLLQCDLVLRQFKVWEEDPNGAERIKLLAKAWTQFHRIIHKKTRAPLTDPELYRFKTETVKELRTVLRLLRNDFLVRDKRVPIKEAIKQFAATVSNNADGFRQLKANLKSWTEYLAVDKHRVTLLAAGDPVGPAALFDAWLGWRTKNDPEKLRQKISALPGRTPHWTAKL